MMLGTFVMDIMRASSTRALTSQESPRVVVLEDLSSAGDLLAVGPNHPARILAGDLCIATLDNLGNPVGIVWLNLVNHTDRYLGGWSKPSPSTVYLNQLYVSPDDRGKGVALSLLRGALAHLAARGRTSVTAAVAKDNPASRRVFCHAEFKAIARVYGIRFGDSLTIRTARRVAETHV